MMDEGFDAENMGLDLSKDEKLRATALLLASRYYVETICKDGARYVAMVTKGETLKPATSNAIVGIACQFEEYLRNGKVKFIKSIDEDLALIDVSESKPAPDVAAE